MRNWINLVEQALTESDWNRWWVDTNTGHLYDLGTGSHDDWLIDPDRFGGDDDDLIDREFLRAMERGLQRAVYHRPSTTLNLASKNDPANLRVCAKVVRELMDRLPITKLVMDLYDDFEPMPSDDPLESPYYLDPHHHVTLEDDDLETFVKTGRIHPRLLSESERLAESEADLSQPVLADMLTRVDRREFEAWLQDNNDEWEAALADPEVVLHELELYLGDEHSIRIGSNGLTTFWKLTPEVERIIGDNPVELYHFTSSPRVPSIRRHGLLDSKPSVNHTKTPGVYLTTEGSGPAVRGYAHKAVNSHRGKVRDNAHAVMITVKMYLHEIRPDPDDEDLSSGEFQFVCDHVPPERIVEIDRV